MPTPENKYPKRPYLFISVVHLDQVGPSIQDQLCAPVAFKASGDLSQCLTLHAVKVLGIVYFACSAASF